MSAVTLLLVQSQAAALPAASVKPKIVAPLFEKQKKLKAAVHASGAAMLAAVTDGVAHALLSKSISDSDSGGVTFDLSLLDKETLSLGCWSPAAITALGGAKLDPQSLKALEGFKLEPATVQNLSVGKYSPELVQNLRAKSASAAVLKLLKPNADAAAELRRACRWPLDYADLAKTGLKKGMIIRLTDAEKQTDEQVVAQASPVKVFLHTPKEGDQVVKGEVVGDADKVRVEVYDSRSSIVDFDTASVDASSPNQPAKTFTAGMNRRLAAGQTVRIIAFKEDSEQSATDYTLVETVGFDWGRVRAYFSAGATVATGEVRGTRTAAGSATTVPEYSWRLHSADYFVALNLDYNWLSNLRDRNAHPCPIPAKEKEELMELVAWIDQIDSGKRWRQLSNAQLTVYLERFRQLLAAIVSSSEAAISGREGECSAVEIERLRALPRLVETGGKDKVSGKSLLERARAEAQDSEVSSEDRARLKVLIDEIEEALQDYVRHHYDTPPAGKIFNTSFEGRLGQAAIPGAPPATATILESSNAGSVEVAAYAPMWSQAMAWRHANRENALFIAPLAKLSLLAAQDGPVPEDRRAQLFKHLYPAHHYGVRFGHFALDARRNSIAPELISFLDITAGKFHNFRRAPSPQPNATRDPDAVDIPTRVEFHGRFKIPSMPITIGFAANMGAGRDDMRIFFGTRFDIGRLLARALPSVGE